MYLCDFMSWSETVRPRSPSRTWDVRAGWISDGGVPPSQNWVMKRSTNLAHVVMCGIVDESHVCAGPSKDAVRVDPNSSTVGGTAHPRNNKSAAWIHVFASESSGLKAGKTSLWHSNIFLGTGWLMRSMSELTCSRRWPNCGNRTAGMAEAGERPLFPKRRPRPGIRLDPSR